jgi:hypothetical protein
MHGCKNIHLHCLSIHTNKLLGTYSLQRTYTYITSFHMQSHNEWNIPSESCIQAQTANTVREQLTPAVLCTLI